MKWNEQSPAIKSARRIVERLVGAGHVAYWVGGCVRDALLGLEPKDIDIATDAIPERVQMLFPRTVPVGARFGVVLIVDGEARTEVATFRSDGEYLDARRPTTVTFGSPNQDAQRRDFTINGLFYDPLMRRVHDYVDGRRDLESGVLRAIGDPRQRFAEDALRLLRAIRFAIRFGFEIEPATREALVEMADGILRVSAERVRVELTAMFTGPRAGAALRELDATGLLERVLPEVAAMRGVPQPPQFHPEGDVFEHTALALDALEPGASPTLAFATLLHDVGKPRTIVHADRIRFNLHHRVGRDMADSICGRLCFSNTERERVRDLVASHMHFMDIRRMRMSRLREFLGMEGFDEHLALHRADCLSSHGNLDNYDFCRDKLEEFSVEDARPLLPAPLIGGDDLIARGFRPGPRMGEILRAAREAQLNDELNSKEAALDWVAERFGVAE